MEATIFMLLAAVLLFMSDAPVPSEQGPTMRELVQMVDAEWAEIFRARGAVYVRSATASGQIETGGAPHPPAYIPLDSSGMGWIVLDDRFPDAVHQALPDEAITLNAFLVAHEIGHHVQAQKADGKVVPNPFDATAMELQADCYAGAILARLDKKARRPGFNPDSIATLLPKLFSILSEVNGFSENPAPGTRGSHGFDYERIDALRNGARAADPAVCES